MRHIMIILLLISGVILSSCARVPMVRTLPEYVNSVYVPMARNLSYEPAVEEMITNLTIDEFLADGRLRVEKKENADITVNIDFKAYETNPSHLYDDDFPTFSEVTARANIFVTNNLDGSLLADFSNVSATYSYVSDPRRVVEEVEPQAKEHVLTNLARAIVLQVITGEYGEQ